VTSVSRSRTTSTIGWIRRGATANLVLPLAALATGPILARALGADGRGALAAVTVPVLLGYTALTLGLPETLTFYVARTGLSPRQLRLLTFWVPLALGGVAVALAWFAMPLLLHQYPQHITLGRLVFLAVPLTLVVQNVRGIALGDLAYRDLFRERYLIFVLRLVPVVVLSLLGALTVGTAAVAAVAAGFASAGLLVPSLRRVARRAAAPADPAAPPRPATGEVVRYGALVWFGSVAHLVVLRLDQIVLAAVVPAAALGAYAVAVSLSEVSNALTAAVREVLHGKGSDREDPALLARGCRLALAVATGFFLFATPVVHALLVPVFGADFRPAVGLTQVLLLAAVGSGLGAVTGTGLAVAGRPGTWSLVQLAGMVATVALVLPVVSAYGVLGAAWLSVVTYLLTALVGVGLLSRITGLPLTLYLLPQRTDLRSLRGLGGRLGRARS